MVSSFVRSGIRIHVLQFLQCLVQMTPNYVRWRNRLPMSSAKEKASLAFANEVFEHICDVRVKINLTKAVGRFEPLFWLISAPRLINLVKNHNRSFVCRYGHDGRLIHGRSSSAARRCLDAAAVNSSLNEAVH